MATLSSQDVRAKVLSLRDELLRNLTFIETCIAEDRAALEKYFKKFKDLKYRPVLSRDGDGNPLEYGAATEIIMEPLATQFRTTVKSLLDSIRVIEGEILPEDNPEGKDAGSGAGSEARRAALRAGFIASQNETAEAPKPIEGAATGAEPVRVPAPGPETPKPPKSWRDTVPGRVDTPKVSTPALQPIVDEAKPETPKSETKPRPAIGLSPALRAQLQSGVGSSSLGAIRDKYSKPKGSKDDAD